MTPSKRTGSRRPSSPRSSAFGAYLRELRTASGASLRTVASAVGISFPHLGRIERGEVGRPPSIYVLTRVADYFGRPLEEVLSRAGVRVELNQPVHRPTADEQFRRLMLRAEFVSPGMKEEYLQHFPQVHRSLILDLACAVERHTERRLRWEFRKELGGETSPRPISMKTVGEVVGAATTREVLSSDWDEEDAG